MQRVTFIKLFSNKKTNKNICSNITAGGGEEYDKKRKGSKVCNKVQGVQDCYRERDEQT